MFKTGKIDSDSSSRSHGLSETVQLALDHPSYLCLYFKGYQARQYLTVEISDLDRRKSLYDAHSLRWNEGKVGVLSWNILLDSGERELR